MRDALSTLVKHLAERNNGRVELAQVREMCNYLREIQAEHKDYKKAEEDTSLFGRNLEMADMRNSKTLAMRVVPVSPQEFKMLKCGPFIAFLAAFGIRRPNNSGKG